MAKFDLTINGKTYEVDAPNKEALPEIAETIASQTKSKPKQTGVLRGVENFLGSTYKTMGSNLSPQNDIANKLYKGALNLSPAFIPGGKEATQGFIERPLQRGIMAAGAAAAIPGVIETGVPSITAASVANVAKPIIGAKIGEAVGDFMGYPNIGATAGGILGGMRIGKGAKYSDSNLEKPLVSVKNQIETKMSDIRGQYSKAYKPFYDKPISILNDVPKRLRNKLIKEYGGQVLDSKGKPVVTIKNAITMREALQDMISMPKEALSRMKINSSDLIKAKSAIKQKMLDAIPKESRDIISMADDAFSKTYDKGNQTLKNLFNKDIAKTEYVAKIFKNRDYAGARKFLKDLSEIGIDTRPLIKTFSAYAKSVNRGKFFNKVISDAARFVGLKYMLGGLGRSLND